MERRTRHGIPGAREHRVQGRAAAFADIGSQMSFGSVPGRRGPEAPGLVLACCSAVAVGAVRDVREPGVDATRLPMVPGGAFRMGMEVPVQPHRPQRDGCCGAADARSGIILGRVRDGVRHPGSRRGVGREDLREAHALSSVPRPRIMRSSIGGHRLARTPPAMPYANDPSGEENVRVSVAPSLFGRRRRTGAARVVPCALDGTGPCPASPAARPGMDASRQAGLQPQWIGRQACPAARAAARAPSPDTGSRAGRMGRGERKPRRSPPCRRAVPQGGPAAAVQPDRDQQETGQEPGAVREPRKVAT